MPESATDFANRALLCLGARRVMFIGRLGMLSPHRHPIAICLIGIHSPLRISTAGREEMISQTAIIPAGLAHSLDARGEPLGVIYGDPHQPYYRRLSPHRPCDLSVVGPEAEASLVTAVRNLHISHQAGGRLCFEEFEAAAERALGIEASTRGMDERIASTIARMNADIDRNHAIEELAGCVGLSASRLRHLFVEEIGVPLRTFRIWIRLRRAVELAAAGQSITSAALDAGFANSSHFSHTFKATFGLNAASLLKGASPGLRLETLQ